ncbi:uncharacterized protein LOC141660217 [Apium graveolens]|uniref:uncharacterized protein LOC141660217 n=1 Tax=Apium graveolens TaxID=4045 RepID=UPI003D7A8881
MDVEGEKWIFLPNYSDKYRKGVEDFVTIAFSKYAVGKELMCPCKTCSNRFWTDAKGIREHLICNGPCPHYLEWIYEVSTLRMENMIGDMDEMDTDIGMGLGDEFEAMIQNVYGTGNDTGEDGVRKGMNADARKFYTLVNEGRQPLYPESKKFTRLSFIVRLYQLKCIHGFSEAIFSDLLDLIKEAFPKVNMPWKVLEDKNGPNMDISKSKEQKVPTKVLRYFPLKPRLQRMFQSSDYSNSMTWHALARKKDGKFRHPGDGKGWKSLDTKYPEFGAEMRNVRLGLAADRFNPYRSMNISHSTWPVVLLLIKELKELWKVGKEIYDVRVDNTFRLHAGLLWTISDFPGYAVLLGWGTKSKLACPSCHYETSSTYLKHSKKVVYLNHRKFLPPDHKWRFDRRRFNGDVELLGSPELLTGIEVEHLLCGYENDLGKQQKKHRGSSSDCPWKKKSIFFELPY